MTGYSRIVPQRLIELSSKNNGELSMVLPFEMNRSFCYVVLLLSRHFLLSLSLIIKAEKMVYHNLGCQVQGRK